MLSLQGEKECIAVGCVPSAAVAASAHGGVGGVPAPGWVPGLGGCVCSFGGYLLRGRGVPAPGGMPAHGGCLLGGVPAWRGGIPACTEADPPL